MTHPSKAFLFRFGYCTPEQWTANEKHGWDDESSGAFFVHAESEQSALDWGNAVADAFVARQFELAGWTAPPSWKQAQFANWIEENPEEVFSGADLGALPRVEVGEMPSLDGWRPFAR